MEKLPTLSIRPKRAYDSVKGFIYGAAQTESARSFIDRELDLLYEDWLRLKAKYESSNED